MAQSRCECHRLTRLPKRTVRLAFVVAGALVGVLRPADAVAKLCFSSRAAVSRRHGLSAAVSLGGALALGPLPSPASAVSRGQQLPDNLPEFSLASGLKYSEVKVGDGPAAASGTRVTVDYVMASARGRFGFSIIDRTKDHESTFSFVVGDPQVIAGLSEGVLGMKAGGIRRLVVPASLTYLADESKFPSPAGFTNYQVFKNYYLNPNMNPVPDLIIDVKMFQFQ
mmetsp:Transcript_28701/g.66597  ORF Transcript_28701/g.66597 Transcript_28701/m.66597 type:complete len:225 (-) Transcript_28701:73-747(-)